MTSFIKGITDCLQGFNLILKPGIRRFVLVPLLVNIVLFTGAIFMLWRQLEHWLQDLLPGWLAWLEWLIVPLFTATMLLLVFYGFTLVANLIAAPFNSLLAARIENRLTGSTPADTSGESLWKLALRTTASEVRKLFYFAIWLIPLTIITFIPGLNIIAPLCWFIYAAWSFSLEYMDYPLANHGQLFTEIRQHNRKHRMRSLGFGTGVFVLTSIPFINFLAMPVAVAGATRLTTATQDH